MLKNTQESINWIIDMLRKDQSPNGSWNYPFETGLATDAYMIILLRTLEINDEELITGLAKRIANKQEKNGAWKLFYDEESGNLSATIEAYYSLLYSGYFQKEDTRMQAAKRFILKNGGLDQAGMFTKIMLSLTGHYHWPIVFPVPLEIILLPLSFPVNFYDFSVFGRANLAPILIVADKKFTIKPDNSPDLADLFIKRNTNEDWVRSPEWIPFFSHIEEGVKQLAGMPEKLHALALKRAKRYLLDHIEQDGTLYSYFSSTFLMIFAFLALDYKKENPLIVRAIEGLLAMKTEINGLPHMQYTTASVWNTSLISSTLQKAGISAEDPVIQRSSQFLLDHQHKKFGDWVIHNPSSLPGGWGFSTVNTMNPDIDDTTASLRALARNIQHRADHQDSWIRGLNWLLTMQNNDGGWPSFEKNTDHNWLALLPIEKGEILLSDPSSADLTGRTLEFFGHYTNLSKTHPLVNNSIKWLFNTKKPMVHGMAGGEFVIFTELGPRLLDYALSEYLPLFLLFNKRLIG